VRHSEAFAQRLNIQTSARTDRPENRTIHPVIALLTLDIGPSNSRSDER